MFESFDDNQDGIIDAGELSNALQYYKCVPFVFEMDALLI
jgi:Ca2+-binding EF-hand superfamily protein